MKLNKNMLSDQKTGKICISGALFALFIVFTVLVKVVDVKAIGPQGSKVGFAALNSLFMRQSLGVFWYKLAEVCGILVLLVVAVFACIGAVELFMGKSINAVEYRILLLGVFYVVVFALYIVFDKIPLNYRPLIIDPAEGLEPSYPSSHTLLAISVMGTAFMQIDNYLSNARYNRIARYAAIALTVVTVLARTISGAHWITDIIGAIILSAALVMLYAAALDYVEAEGAVSGKHTPAKAGRHSR